MCFRPAAWVTQVRSGWNRLEFDWRNRLQWSQGAYQEQAELKDGIEIPSDLGLYDLSGPFQRATNQRYREILSYLSWLDDSYQAAPEIFNRLFQQADETRWLDVGAKNWAYVDALNAFLKARLANAAYHIDGVELDPYRRYTDLHTRQEYAQAFTAHLPQATYHAGNILDWQQPAHVISHFLPFVYEEPLLRWGLPLAYFQPQTILNHLLTSLPDRGVLLIVNQGEAEAEAQFHLLEQAAGQFPIHFKNLGQLPSRFIEYQYPRFGWLCVREAPHEQSD